MGSRVNERELILDILLSVTRDGEFSHIALKRVLDNYQYLTKNERAFITRVTEGTLERRIELDYVIDQFSKTKVKKMKPVIREILRSGVYQIRYMDSVPDSAVCNEAVKLAKKRGFSGLSGFVNGVLRSVGRSGGELRLPEKSRSAARLSIWYSMPEWIVEQWLAEYPAETVERILADFLREKPTVIRCNQSRISRRELIKKLESEGVKASPHPANPQAVILEDYDYLGALESFRAGYFQVQDVSSMEVARWAAPEKGDRIIDVCAAPGGKALHLADLLDGSGLVEARDLTPYKVDLIRENIARAGMTNIRAVCQDATVFDPASENSADLVIADLPCSGLGVLGKKPDLKYRMTPEKEAELARLQREILQVVCRYVKPGGRLLYSTCTINREENQGNAGWFAASFPEFHLLRDRQFLPGTDDSDGFYIAEFCRDGTLKSRNGQEGKKL